MNDNSTDESFYVLHELNNTFKCLTIVDLGQEPKLISGKKFPLSVVFIREAQHEVLLLQIVCPASEFWLEKCRPVRRWNRYRFLGYGAYQKLPGFLNKVIRFETFIWPRNTFSYALAGKTYMGVGRNLSYKSIFLKNKGFALINHIPGGDDDLFINKVATKNTAIVIDHEAHTISKPKTTWKHGERKKKAFFLPVNITNPFTNFC